MGDASCASWSTLPQKYPLYQTCHRRFKTWFELGVLLRKPCGAGLVG
ncbi:putative transposase protein [Burkholderia sp. YI23]|nr:putative transposase protein [Burkholderia sp. YI23]